MRHALNWKFVSCCTEMDYLMEDYKVLIGTMTDGNGCYLCPFGCYGQVYTHFA